MKVVRSMARGSTGHRELQYLRAKKMATMSSMVAVTKVVLLVRCCGVMPAMFVVVVGVLPTNHMHRNMTRLQYRYLVGKLKDLPSTGIVYPTVHNGRTFSTVV